MRVTTAVLLALAINAAAQEAPPPLTQRIDVNLVNVDVTVLDAAGNPVTDLARDEFELREDDAPQEITNFSVVRSEKVTPPKPAQPDWASDPDRQRSVVALMDVRALGEKPQRARAIEALRGMLSQYPDSSKWSIVILRVGTRSMQTLLPMTSDRAAINAALDAVREGVSLPSSQSAAMKQIRVIAAPEAPCRGPCAGIDMRAGIDAAQEMQSSVSFFSAVVQLARGVAWLPGKKVLLIVSSAVPGYLSPVAGTIAISEAQMHERMLEEANAAGANIYVVDPLGVSAQLEMGRGDYFGLEAGRPSRTGQRSVAGAEWLSLGTGGLYMPSNDLRKSFDQLERATTNYYELGYHAAAADGKYHRISLTVKRPGKYTVTHRQGYLRLSKEDGFIRAMTSPLGIASQKPTLPLQLAVDGSKEANVSFRATLPVKALQSIGSGGERMARAHLYVSVFDSEGRLVKFDHFVETLRAVAPSDERTLAVVRSLALPKGTYKLFVSVRDELTDEVGVAVKDVTF